MMDQHGPLAFIALGDEFRVEPLGQHEVELDRAALPASRAAVRQMELPNARAD
ncbi:hypothetical protein [Paraburkholderia sp. RAU2J]|uniref:hypothetical protein n=1 Tax=Paraburkholderia sp. RAU2J TaxID=1938810 RepID=UPI001F5463AE|nr:hypothetical protein [Paraburkholderia sp. RAU2J]